MIHVLLFLVFTYPAKAQTFNASAIAILVAIRNIQKVLKAS